MSEPVVGPIWAFITVAGAGAPQPTGDGLYVGESPCSGCETGLPSRPFAFRSATAFTPRFAPLRGHGITTARALRRAAVTRHNAYADDVTASRMLSARCLRGSGTSAPAATRPRLRLPGTTRPRFALPGAQRRRVAVLRMRNGTSQSPFRLPLGDGLYAPVRPAPRSRHHHGARPAARCRVSP